jgi:uncharacterized membrane protein
VNLGVLFMYAKGADQPPIPAHVADTVQAIADVHLEHHRHAGWLQRSIDRGTRLLSKPAFTPIVTVIVVGWVLINLAVTAIGDPAPDPPPFNYLFGFLSLAALYMTGIILATQRRENELATRREQLTLQLAILNERKTAKLIEMVEKLRREQPSAVDRRDNEAEAMASPADPRAVLAAIEKTHKEPR